MVAKKGRTRRPAYVMGVLRGKDAAEGAQAPPPPPPEMENPFLKQPIEWGAAEQ